MKQVLCSILLCLLITYANAQTGTDSILTTKGAVTLITSGAPISTFRSEMERTPITITVSWKVIWFFSGPLRLIHGLLT